MPSPVWYFRRLRRMSPAEVGWRTQDRIRQELWTRRSFGPAPQSARDRRGPVVPTAAQDAVPEDARAALIDAADRLLDGKWEVLGTLREDMVAPDWSLDPTSGRSYPERECSFRIDYRSAGDGRNVKQVWELSRHHHLTVLAAAFWLTGDERYATRAAEHLRSWWQANPVLTGVNWNSGIELGIRLISWVWTRRLLEAWQGAPDLFENNPVAHQQVYWHQRWLAAFRSKGSSANNHVIAEAAGQLVASTGFDWFGESAGWAADATALLEAELGNNTFDDGLNREQAFEYHGLVTQLGVIAAAEAQACGRGPGLATWHLLCRSVDALAALADEAGGPPRYGDGDDGRALVVDDPAASRWASLLATGAALFGPQRWWPQTTADVQSVWLAAMVGRRVDGGRRAERRGAHFPDAGVTILRSPPGEHDEIWCRLDGGPHGFLSIAAHAHADALSVEVRVGGIEVLADPGTYCYYSQPAFRRYFRSTLGHNTLELGGLDQSVAGGPFMWIRRAESSVLEADVDGTGLQRWSASHDGYERLEVPVIHRRTVTLRPVEGRLEIVDELETDGSNSARLAFHLGPSVEAVVEGNRAILCWVGPHAEGRRAVLTLPTALTWKAYRGSAEPVLGWYSSGFGRLQPATTLVGTGELGRSVLRTVFSLSQPLPEPLAQQ